MYRFTDVGGSVAFGVNLSNVSQVRLGYVSMRRRSEVQTGISNLPGIDQRIVELDERDAGLLARFMFDSREADTFALRGAAAELLYLRSDRSLGGGRDWSRAEGGLRKGFEIRENAMWLTLAGGIDLSEDRLPGDRTFSLGGPTPIGTLTVGLGGAAHSWGFWLSLGRPVGKGSILDQGLFR